MHINRAKDAVVNYEYGCDLRRLYPWPGVASPVWGSAIAAVRPGEATEPHAHDECETFIVLSGHGRMEIQEETALLEDGDVVFIPRNRTHCFRNVSDHDPLVFISIYWDSPEARARMNTLVSEGREDV